MGTEFRIESSRVGPEDRISALASMTLRFNEALAHGLRWRTAALVLLGLAGLLGVLILVGAAS